jgi:hypothetical protein
MKDEHIVEIVVKKRSFLGKIKKLPRYACTCWVFAKQQNLPNRLGFVFTLCKILLKP